MKRRKPSLTEQLRQTKAFLAAAERVRDGFEEDVARLESQILTLVRYADELRVQRDEAREALAASQQQRYPATGSPR